MISHVAFLLKTRITAYPDCMSMYYVKDTQSFLQNMLRNENNEGNDSNNYIL